MTSASIGTVCYPPSGFAPDVMLAFMETFIHDPGILNGNFLLKKTGPSLDEARNQIADYFLETSDSGDYLVFVDSDQVWAANDMYEFILRAAENDIQQASALIPRYVEPEHRIECPFVVTKVREDGYLETKAMAGGVYLIRRDLITEIKERFGSVFISAAIGMHEDSMLGQRIKTLLKPVLVDPRFRVGHIKAQTLRFPDDFDPST